MRMMLFDSHLHFDTFHEAGEVDAVLSRAREAGVTRMVAIGGTSSANRLAVDLARMHPERIAASAGYDRDEALKEPDGEDLRRLLDDPGVVAVGETGLDYHYHPDTADAQQSLFRQMLDLGHERNLPTVVHSRDADEDTLSLLGDQVARWRGEPRRVGVLHCFTGTADFARRLVEMGIMVSFSGIVTFKNAESIREAARVVPDELLLIETDAPYLAPVPHRGKRNEPAFVRHVAECLAEVRHCRPEDIAAITMSNAEHLFKRRKDKNA
jgi:TatD DNase family protein